MSDLNKIRSIVFTYLSTNLSKKTWESYSMERQIREIVCYLDTMSEIKSTCVDVIIYEDLAESWMNKYQELKDKYEPDIIVFGDDNESGEDNE